MPECAKAEPSTVSTTFDAALRDPKIPTQMREVDDCGDGLHSSDGGNCKMGDAIDLALFD